MEEPLSAAHLETILPEPEKNIWYLEATLKGFNVGNIRICGAVPRTGRRKMQSGKFFEETYDVPRQVGVT